MTAAHALPVLVALPLAGAALLVATGRWLPRRVADVLGCGCAAATAVLAGWTLVRGGRGSGAVEWVGGWHPRDGSGVGIVLVGDGAGLGLAVLVSVLVVAALGYSWHFFDDPPRGHAGAFPALVLVFQAGMCGFTLTGDLFNAFVFFELMGVISYALTGYRVEEARAVQGALTFGFLNSLGGYATLLGVGLLYARTGELGFAQIGARLDARGGPDALVTAALALVATGLLVKAAAVPFHFWLPDAHTVAPTPVCMLLSGVMVELGVYGVARLYFTVFAGPGGVPAEAAHRALLVLGVLTAVAGALLCWLQRHIKRLLAFSTIAHTGMFLMALAALTPKAVTGTGVYLLAHAGVKAALFACTGILLDRYRSVDERELRGRGRELPWVGGMFALAGLALAGLPPFGTGLGKALSEEATGSWQTALFVLVSAATGGAVLRVAAGVFLGLGPAPAPGPAPGPERAATPAEEPAGAGVRKDPATSGAGEPETRTAGGEPEAGGGTDTRGAGKEPEAGGTETSAADDDPETSGAQEEPETGGTLTRVPGTMLFSSTALLAGGLAVGCVPALWAAVSRASEALTDHTGYAAAVLHAAPPPDAPAPPPHWSPAGIVLGLLSTALALTFAGTAVRARSASRTAAWSAPLRRLHSGHLGDYVACALLGITLLAALLW